MDQQVPYNKREKAMEAFHNNHYLLENASEILEKIHPTNGSDWTAEEKETFRLEIFRQRKDFKALSVLLKKDMGDILSYYLGTYKKSDEYRLLKTVLIEEKIEKARSSLHNIDQCAICEDGGSLLICDGCESEWHMTCTRPVLKAVPEGRWECDLCVDRKFLEGWQRTIRATGIQSKNGKRKREIHESDNAEAPPTKDPKSQLVDALKSFSSKLDSIFTPVSATLMEAETKQA
jgi:PHD-finger